MMKIEEVTIRNQYKELCEKLVSHIEPEDQLLIDKAFYFAYDAHKGSLRLSNAPYITHPINVASIVGIELGLDPVCIAVALLHDVVEDTDVSLQDLEEHFGKEVTMMVDGLTKINSDPVGYHPERYENLQKMLSYVVRDTRIIPIKLADRLDNMRSMGFLSKTKQLYMASETKEVYVRLASVLGLEAIKREMKDLCLKTIHPDKYYMISSMAKEHDEKRKGEIHSFIAMIQQALKEQDIPFYIVTRSKSISSIYDKMCRKKVSFHEVYDLIGIRIILTGKDETLSCWRVYNIITSLYRYDKKRTKDWITKSTERGYESLHLTIMSDKGSSVEVQIRTARMDKIASVGAAAHWKYKERSLDRILADSDAWSRNILDTVRIKYDRLKEKYLEKARSLQTA